MLFMYFLLKVFELKCVKFQFI